MYDNPEDEEFWTGVMDFLDKWDELNTKDPEKYPFNDEYLDIVLSFVRAHPWAMPLMGASSDECYTPIEIVESARRVMGEIDLDPASNGWVNKHRVKAKHFYSKEKSGLTKPWKGRIFLNPPYSKGLISRFIHKLIKEYREGRTKEAVVLWIFSPGGSKHSLAMRDTAKALCIVNEHLNFDLPDGKIHRLGFTSAVYYLGPNVDAFSRELSKWGRVVRL